MPNGDPLKRWAAFEGESGRCAREFTLGLRSIGTRLDHGYCVKVV